MKDSEDREWLHSCQDMKTSSSSAASASTLTYESDISSRRSHYLNGYNTSSHSKQAKQEEARLFDLVLKKLETVRMVKARERIHNHSSHDIDTTQRNSDNAARRSDAHVQQRDDLRPLQRANHSMRDSVSEQDESVVTDTEDSSNDGSSDDSSRGRFSSRDFTPIHRTAQRDGTTNSHRGTNAKKSKQAKRPDDNSLSEEKLPDAILKLDRRHAIPRPRHKNDILVEIEVRLEMLLTAHSLGKVLLWSVYTILLKCCFNAQGLHTFHVVQERFVLTSVPLHNGTSFASIHECAKNNLDDGKGMLGTAHTHWILVNFISVASSGFKNVHG